MTEPIKAGDKLVRTVVNTWNRIARRDVMIVDRVTRSGRVKIRFGSFDLNPDLSVRGSGGTFLRFERCTPEMEAEVKRENEERAECLRLQMEMDEVRWCKVPLEKLRQVAAIVSDDTKITGGER
jgi:hypothetical protein